MALNLCVLASGSGSNLKAIINAQKPGKRKIRSKVVLVISNNSSSGALKTAARFKIPSYHLSLKLFKNQTEYDKKLLSLLNEFKIDMIILAGYMKMISPRVIRKYKNRILNIHPALLPQFGGKGMFGLNVHKAVLNAGVKTTGVTVHLVDGQYDNGMVIMQKPVMVKDGDDAEELRKRVLRAEHKLYPEVIQLFENNRVSVKKNKVIIINHK